MNDIKLPIWFWAIAALAVVWNIMGVSAYLGDVMIDEEALQAMNEAERNLRAATPGWVTGAFATAVFGGLAASIVLAMRRVFAVPLFAISLVAVVVQMGYIFIGMDAAAVLGNEAMIFPAIIIVISALLLWFSISAKNRGWLR